MCCQTPIALVYAAAIKVRAYLCRDTLSVDFAIFQIEVQTSNGLLGVPNHVETATYLGPGVINSDLQCMMRVVSYPDP